MGHLTESHFRPNSLKWILIAALALCPIRLSAQSVDPIFVVNSPAARRLDGGECLRLVESMNALPAEILSNARAGAGEQLAVIGEWNREVKRPVKNGFERPLSVPVRVDLNAVALENSASDSGHGVFVRSGVGGDLVWGTRITVEEAYRLRLHLADVNLPGDAVLWVYSEDSTETVSFGIELTGPGGDIWTPSIGGASISLEVRVPGRAANQGFYGFSIDSVMQIFPLGTNNSPIIGGSDTVPLGTWCFGDASCYGDETLPHLDDYKNAYAKMLFSKDGGSYTCSGALLNDTDAATLIPYFYTAMHCIANQVEAASLETYWDYRTSVCNGVWPSKTSLQRINGSTLLTVLEDTDSTLLRLSANPAGYTVYLGWDPDWVENGTILYLLSHPGAFPLVYSEHEVVAPRFVTCSSRPTTNFTYETRRLNGTGSGGSGAPTFDRHGRVRGQYTGRCGFDLDDFCAQTFDYNSGRFSNFYPIVSRFLGAISKAYVEPKGTCGGKEPCYSGIQTAVDDVDPGTDIEVAAGEYNENIIIDNSVTVEIGWDPDFTTLNQPDPVILSGS